MGVHSTSSREEAQLHLVCCALWLLSTLCGRWVDAECIVNVCFVDSSGREHVSVHACKWGRKCMCVFVQVHQMHLCEQDKKTKVCPSFLQTSQSHWLISVLVAPPFTVSCLSVGSRQAALWHAQSTDLYLRSHTVSFMLFFQTDLWAAPPGLSHWQRPSFVCHNRSHTTVLPFILSSLNPPKRPFMDSVSQLSFLKDCSKDALVYCMIKMYFSNICNMSTESKCLHSLSLYLFLTLSKVVYRRKPFVCRISRRRSTLHSATLRPDRWLALTCATHSPVLPSKSLYLFCFGFLWHFCTKCRILRFSSISI